MKKPEPEIKITREFLAKTPEEGEKVWFKFFDLVLGWDKREKKLPKVTA